MKKDWRQSPKKSWVKGGTAGVDINPGGERKMTEPRVLVSIIRKRRSVRPEEEKLPIRAEEKKARETKKTLIPTEGEEVTLKKEKKEKKRGR